MMKIINSKTLLSLIAIISLLSACKSASASDDISSIKKEIESKIMERINDPESYSFIELQVIETVYYSSILNNHLNFYNNSIEDNKMFLNSNTELLNTLTENAGAYISDPDIQNILKNYKDQINDHKLRIAKFEQNIERAKILTDEYSDKSFLKISFLYRERNEFGALVLIDKIYEVELNNDVVEIIWSGYSDLLDECEDLNYAEWEVWEAKCIPFYNGTANNRLSKKIEDI